MHTYAAVCDSKLNLSQTLTCCPFLVFALHLPPVVSVFAAHTVWNSLPSGIRDSSSTHTFRRLLKTHCFQQAFGSPSGSPKCLRFGLWLTLNIDLLTYLQIITNNCNYCLWMWWFLTKGDYQKCHTIVWRRLNGFNSEIFSKVLNGSFTWKLHDAIPVADTTKSTTSFGCFIF